MFDSVGIIKWPVTFWPYWVLRRSAMGLSRWLELMKRPSKQSPLTAQMPWLVYGLRRISRSWLLRAKPQLADAIRFFNVRNCQNICLNPTNLWFLTCKRGLDNAISDKHMRVPNHDHPIIFHDLLKSVPRRNLSEGFVVVASGALTTAYYLKTTCYHILANSVVLRRLQEELNKAMRNSHMIRSSLNGLCQLASRGVGRTMRVKSWVAQCTQRAGMMRWASNCRWLLVSYVWRKRLTYVSTCVHSCDKLA